MPVSTLESTDLSVNQTTLNALTGVTFPAEVLQTAYLYQ
ncbi:unknown [Firmicutes bacterium CAG:94]|nr:unknown [Firmicutes bacterium CAG:94]